MERLPMPNLPLKDHELTENRLVRNDTHEAGSASLLFEFAFTVEAPLAKVAEFHRDVQNLRRLTPPPLRIQFHRIEPLSEGSLSEFTLWFGVIPVRWLARHDNVDALHGFRDTQVEGVMRRWEHTHLFTSESESASRVSERIVYAHNSGFRGLFTRLLFNRFALKMNFMYRRAMTRRVLRAAQFGSNTHL